MLLDDAQTYPTLPANDLARARRFYEGTLGFKPSMVTPQGVMYNTECSSLFVYPSQFAGTNKATAAGFNVSDIRATVAQLKAKGVHFEEYDIPGAKTVDSVSDSPNGLAAWFKDTEGNIVGLIQLH